MHPDPTPAPFPSPGRDPAPSPDRGFGIPDPPASGPALDPWDSDRLDELLGACAPPIAVREGEVLSALDELVLASRPVAPRRRRVPRTAVVGLVLAGTLGISGAAAAGGYLPMSMTPWRQHALADGTDCQLRFQATEQTEPTRLAGRVPSQTEERTTVLAAQEFLDGYDVSTIDVDAWLQTLRTERAKEEAKLPPSEWAPSTPHEDEIQAMVMATFAELSAALERQGLDPDVVNIATPYECGDQS